MELRLFFLAFFYALLSLGQTILGQSDSEPSESLKDLIKVLESEEDSLQIIQANWNTVNKKFLSKSSPESKLNFSHLGPDGTPIFFDPLGIKQTLKSYQINTIYKGFDDLVDGLDMEIGIWDASLPVHSHREFGNRVVLGDSSAKENKRHATISTGGIIASGAKRKAKGILPAARAIVYDWHRDRFEAAQMAAKGLLVSNHSYGIAAKNLPNWYFGRYLLHSKRWDDIMYAAPFYQMVVAAGNNQRSKYNDTPLYGTPEQGWDVLLGHSLSKNAITVGAVHINGAKAGNLKNVNVSAYSSLGPTDDGRIKPDLVVDGFAALIPTGPRNGDYDSATGTSIAASRASGFLLGLQQFYFQKNGVYMRAASLKGLALHTTVDVGHKGPDYKMGWGIIDPLKAAKTIQNQGYTTAIRELTLQQGAQFIYEVEANGLEDLMVSLSWTDPAFDGALGESEVNDPTPVLMNDLDINIVQETDSHDPWILNFKTADAPAKRGNNSVDPFEKVEVQNARGVYKIRVSHKGNLYNGMQDFSLVVTGAKLVDCFTSPISTISIKDTADDFLVIDWDEKGEDASYELHFKESDQELWRRVEVDIPNFKLGGLRQGKEYEVRLRAICASNVYAEEYTYLTFTFLGQQTLPMEVLRNDNVFPESLIDHQTNEKLELNASTPLNSNYWIFDFAGQTVAKGTLLSHEISLRGQSQGYYFLVIQSGRNRAGVKFLHRSLGN